MINTFDNAKKLRFTAKQRMNNLLIHPMQVC